MQHALLGTEFSERAIYIYIIGDHTTQIYWNWTKKGERRIPSFSLIMNSWFMFLLPLLRCSPQLRRQSTWLLEDLARRGKRRPTEVRIMKLQEEINELSIVPICFECCYHAYHIIVTVTICCTWNVYVHTICIYIYIRMHIRFPNSTPHTPEVDSMKRMKHEKTYNWGNS